MRMHNTVQRHNRARAQSLARARARIAAIVLFKVTTITFKNRLYLSCRRWECDFVNKLVETVENIYFQIIFESIHPRTFVFMNIAP